MGNDPVSQFINILLLVLGLNRPYPAVSIENIRIIQTPKQVVAEYQAENLVNAAVIQVIRGGNTVWIEARVVTFSGKKKVYLSTVQTTLSYAGGVWTSDLPGRWNNPEEMARALADQRITLCTNAPSGNADYQTVIEYSIGAPGFTDLRTLWGNQPVVRIKFRR